MSSSEDNNKTPSEKPSSSLNVSSLVVEKLIENVLLGNSTIIPSHVLEAMITGISQTNNINKDEGKQSKKQQSILDSTAFPSLESASGSNSNDRMELELGLAASSLSSMNKIKSSSDKNILTNNNNNTAAAILNNGGLIINSRNSPNFDDEDCSMVDEMEDTATRTVTPTTDTQQVPVSEQFLSAKRILRQNNHSAGIEPPDFSHLPPNLEEAFTVSTAHLTQIINNSAQELFHKIEAVFGAKCLKLEAMMEKTTNQIETANQLCREMTQLASAKQEICSKRKMPEVAVKAVSTVPIPIKHVTTNTPTLAAAGAGLGPVGGAKAGAIIKPYDVIANFEIFLTKTKMEEKDVEKHGLQVSKLIGAEALAYMAKFGFVPKYKKK